MATLRSRRELLTLSLGAGLALPFGSANADDSAKADFEVVRVTGRVGWLGDALRERFGLELSPEASERTLAITTAEAEVVPLLEDSRGRAFRLDERLRTMELELVVRRYQKTPLLQVLQILEVTSDGSRAELDYWCDVCAIAMFELKLCECCQGPIELRRRPIAP
ncbi:MAG: hypothetical protein SGJ19_20515 [Planctomycetia bacterium]|nr:hypothetical protein [Planctomycetia bacterium]